MSNPTTTPESKPLWKALFAVQQELAGVKADAVNDYFNGHKYPDRGTVLATLKPLLAKHGLLLVQAPVPTPNGNADALALQTSFVHVESGEALVATAVVPLPKSDPQGYGSALTYTSRYSIISMLALPLLEDDDGNKASTREAKKISPKQERTQIRTAPGATGTETSVVAASTAAAGTGQKLWGDKLPGRERSST